MDTLSSAEFRKTYAKLLRPTVVTVNGHVIGVWEPYKGSHEAAWREALGERQAFVGFVEGQGEKAAADLGKRLGLPPNLEARYDTRPIRPVPKHGK